MALITLIEDELKAHCSAASMSISIEAIGPSIDFCERTYIKPELGTAQYNSLLSAYTDSVAQSPTPMSAEEEALWLHCVRALANLAVWHYAGALATEISNAGMRERNAEDGGGARMWVANLSRDTLYQTGMAEIDNLLTFLDENKADYPDWVAGTGYAGLRSTLLQTTAQFNEHVHIDSSRKLFKMLKPSIKTVEYTEIRRTIAIAFYERLLAGISAGNLTAQEEAALDKLRPAIAHMAIAKSTLPLQFGDAGAYYINQKSGDNAQEKLAATDSFTNEMKREHYDTGKRYLAEAIQYLNETASAGILAEYRNSDRYEDPSDDGYTDLPNNNTGLNSIFSL